MTPTIDNEKFRNLLYSWPEMALVLLYDNYYDSLLRIADMRTRNRQASEDVLQEVFTDVWKKHKELGRRRNEPIQNYLIKAVQYHSITYYRKLSKTTAREKEYYYTTANNASENPVEASIISNERRAFIRLIVGTFPPREKECLLLQIDQSMTVKEIAQRLGISKKAVERSLTSARKRLKRFGGAFW